MPLGNPITIENESRIITVNVLTQTALYTIEGGYKVNHINVYRNGIRLVSGNDYLALDGASVTLLTLPNVNDVLEFHLFDEFLVNDAIVGAASSQVISGDLVINGNLYYNSGVVVSEASYADVAGIATVATYASTSGIATYASTSGIATYASTAGIATNATTATTATNAEGLTGTPNIVVGNITAVDGTFAGDVSVAGTVTYQDVTDVNSVGIITATQGIDITGGDLTGNGSTNISGINSVTATTFYGDGSQLQGVQAGSGGVSIGAAGVDITSSLFT